MRTEGAGSFLVNKVRDKLLPDYKGRENIMQLFGFNGVVGSAASPRRAQSAAKAKPA